jgi:hypothetical protein
VVVGGVSVSDCREGVWWTRLWRDRGLTAPGVFRWRGWAGLAGKAVAVTTKSERREVMKCMVYLFEQMGLLRVFLTCCRLCNGITQGINSRWMNDELFAQWKSYWKNVEKSKQRRMKVFCRRSVCAT